MARKKYRLAAIISLLLVFAVGGQPVRAANYLIDPDGNGDYESLQELADDVLVVLANGDKIILKADDASLTGPLAIGAGIQVTIQSDASAPGRSISAAVAGQRLFTVSGENAGLIFHNIGTISGFGGADGGILIDDAYSTSGNYVARLEDVSFIGNNQDPQGAIEINSTGLDADKNTRVLIAASAGKTVIFSDNGTSIHLAGDNGTTIGLDVDAAAGAVVRMSDTVSLSAAAADYSVTVTKTGAGLWELGGTSTFGATNGTVFEVRAGQLSLLGNAKLEFNADPAGSFSVGSGAAAGFYGGNKIEAPEIRFASGSTLVFGLAHSSADPTANSMLALTGNDPDSISIAGTTVAIDGILQTNGTENTYLLIEGSHNLNSSTTIPLIYNEMPYVASGTGATSSRLTATFIRTPNTKLDLTLSTDNKLLTRVWSGAAAAANWDFTGKYWYYGDDPATTDSFIPGDAVRLGTSSGTDRALNLSADMVVAPVGASDAGKGVYVFGAGNLTLTGAGIKDDRLRLAQLRHDGSGTLTLDNAANTYGGGTYITGGGTLAFSRSDQMGTGGVHFQNNANNRLLALAQGTLDQYVWVDGTSGRGTITTQNRSRLTVTVPGDEVAIAAGTASGGAAHVAGTLTVTGNVLYQGNAANLGGAIFADAGSTLLANDGVVFRSNEAISIDGDTGFGGALDIALGAANPTRSTAALSAIFEQNTAGNAGGAVAAHTNNFGNLTLTESTFRKNTAGNRGGAVYAVGTDVAVIAGKSIFTDNAVIGTGGQGGAVFIDDGTYDDTKGGYTGNMAAQGGAVFLRNNAEGTFDSATFSGNQAMQADEAVAEDVFGGAIYVDGSMLTLTNSTLTGNAAVQDDASNQVGLGGALYLNDAETTIENSVFGGDGVGNTAASGGGAIFAVGDGELNIAGSSFLENTVLNNSGAPTQHGGGAIHASNVALTVTDSTFRGNIVSGDFHGGAIEFVAGADQNTLTIQATEGKTTLFSGNMVNTDTAAQANSVHIDATAEDAVVVIDTEENGVVDMIDPMSGDVTGTATVTKTGLGTWRLGGDSVFTGGGTTNLTVGAGTLQLYGTGDTDGEGQAIAPGTIAVNTTNGSFTLGAAATLLVRGDNVIAAPTVELAAGATLAFDMTDYDTLAPAALLDMQATTWTTNGWAQNIDLRNIVMQDIDPGDTVRYDLMTVDDDTIGTGLMTLLYRGVDMSELRENFGTLLIDDGGPGDKTLYVEMTGPHNGTTLWTNNGGNGNMTWDLTAKNWDGQDDGQYDLRGTTQFLDGDAVIFDGNIAGSAGTITVTGNGVIIADQPELGTVAPLVIPGMTVRGDEDFTFQGGAIGGDGRLLKEGDGVLTFKDANTFTGGTTITGGRVVAEKTTALGDGGVTMENHTVLEFNLITEGEQTYDQTISGDGKLVKSGAGSLRLTDTTNDYTDGTEIRGGSLIISDADVLGQADDVDTGDGNLRGTLVLDGMQGDFDKLIFGSGYLRATGGTDVELTRNNTHTGTTIDVGSRILIRNRNRIGSGTVRVDGMLTIDLSAADAGTLPVLLDGRGLVEKRGNGELTLDKANAFAGDFEQYDGSLRLKHSQALQNATLHRLGGTVSFDTTTKSTLGGLAGTEDIALQNDNNAAVALTIGTNNTDQTYSGDLSGPGSLTKVGSGTQRLAGYNDYAGTTTISGGKLVAVGVEALAGQGAIQNDAVLGFEIGDGLEQEFDKTIPGTGSVEKTGGGTLTLLGENTYTGGTVVADGRLRVNTLKSLGMHVPLENGKGVQLRAPGILEINIADDDSLEPEDRNITKPITGNGTLVKTGEGTLTLEVDSSHSGQTEVREGSLYVNAKTSSATTVFSGATLGGVGAVDNALLFQSGSFHRVEYKKDSMLGLFSAKTIDYRGGSTIYIKVGANATDRIVATDGINFAQGGGTVDVRLVNLGLDEGASGSEKTTADIFVSENGSLTLNGRAIASHQKESDSLTVDGVNGEIRFIADAGDGIKVLGYTVGPNGSSGIGRGISLDLSLSGAAMTSYLTRNQRATLGGIGSAWVLDRIYDFDRKDRGDVLNHLMPMIQTIVPFTNQRVVTQSNLATFERLRFLRDLLEGREPQDGTVAGSSRRLRHLLDGNNYLWFQNYGDFFRLGRDAQRPEFQTDAYGFTVGADRPIDSHAIVGLGMGGHFGKVRANDYYQDGDVDSFLISVYGNWHGNADWVLGGSAGFVFGTYELRRVSPTFETRLDSRHHGTTCYASLEGTKRIYFGRTALAPYVGVDGIWLCEERYRERATGNPDLALTVRKDDHFSLLSSLGVRLERSFTMLDGNIFNPSIYAAWIHDWADGRISSSAAFPGQPAFRIRGASMVRDRAQLGTNVNMTLNRRLDMFGRFNAELGEDFSDLSFHWGIRLGF